MPVWLTLLLTLTNSDLMNLLKHMLKWSSLNIINHRLDIVGVNVICFLGTEVIQDLQWVQNISFLTKKAQ